MSRPIEGLDSLRATVSLRMAKLHAGSADASRPQMLPSTPTGNGRCWRVRILRLSSPSMGRDTPPLPKEKMPPAGGWAGFGPKRVGPLRADAPGPPTTFQNAAKVASARRMSKLQSPRNPGRPGRDSGAREPEARSPAHPPARDMPPRNARRAAAGNSAAGNSAAGKETTKENGRKRLPVAAFEPFEEIVRSPGAVRTRRNLRPGSAHQCSIGSSISPMSGAVIICSMSIRISMRSASPFLSVPRPVM